MKIYLNEKGQGTVEFVLMIVLVAIIVIAAVSLLGPSVGKVFSTGDSRL